MGGGLKVKERLSTKYIYNNCDNTPRILVYRVARCVGCGVICVGCEDSSCSNNVPALSLLLLVGFTSCNVCVDFFHRGSR